MPIASHVRDFASSIVMATHPQWEKAPEVAAAACATAPARAARQALVLRRQGAGRCAEGRYNVSVEDIKAMAAPALRHRIILNFEGEAEGHRHRQPRRQIMESTEVATVQSREPFLR